MKNREELIRALSADLQPVRPAPNIDLVSLVWLLVSALWVVAVTQLLGPLRPNALAQLASEGRFLAETLAGAAAIVLTTLAGFRAAVPGALAAPLWLAAGGLMAAWLATYGLGLISPALEPSMLGKRPHCVWETLVYALPPALAALLLARRLFPLQPLRTAAALGLASGMMPALYMQLACMYMPAHILMFHVLPGLAVVPLAVLLAASPLFRRRPGRPDGCTGSQR